MSISRGTFLKSLGKSLPGMVLGSGVAAAAQTLLGKVAAASGSPVMKHAPASPVTKEEAPKVPFISNGPENGKKIALTFDDGPTPGVTDRILDVLKERGVHATFFMIGSRIAADPDLARRVLAEGHEIGNHTYTHTKLTTLPDEKVAGEIELTRRILRDQLAYTTKWLRPPFGAFRQNQAAVAAKAGLGVVLWSIDSNDWSQPGEERIVEKVLEQVKPGAIILCHDVHAQTVSALAPLLDGLFAQGLELTTLSGLIPTSVMV
jgi:peptidoglycan/xylan/chitin deacetylase (PgdA/CDA1 family)